MQCEDVKKLRACCRSDSVRRSAESRPMRRVRLARIQNRWHTVQIRDWQAADRIWLLGNESPTIPHAG
jgi:hypothetical protein